MTVRVCGNIVADPNEEQDLELLTSLKSSCISRDQSELLSEISGLDEMSWGFEYNASGQMFHTHKKAGLLIGTN